MLGETIAELRRKKGISQEELADVLLTSRQAVSKWERGESDPDIAKLKDLAVYFNVSIDYLLGYDVEATSVNSFIERLKKCSETSVFDISLEEIKVVISRNGNNFGLILAAISYLGDYYYTHHEEGLLDLLTQYIKKAILLFQPGKGENISLNDLHRLAASIYVLKGEYELAKKYIKENQVARAEDLLSQCELALDNFEEVDRISSEVFLTSISSLINNNANQIRAFLRTNRVKEALELSEWSIGLVKSVGKNEEYFLNVIFVLSFTKAYCEKTLGLDYSESLNFLKENRDKTSTFLNISDGFRFYSDQHVVLASESGTVKNDVLNEFNELKKRKVGGYQNASDLFKEVYGE